MLDKSKLWLPSSYKPPNSPKKAKQICKTVYRWTGLPGKTLWDIFQLLGILAIPIVVVIASSLFSIQLNQENLRASNQQHQTDIQIAADQQREAALQNYLDSISGLLLNNKLLQSQPRDAVREVARVQTLTTLRRLDTVRKVILLSFLYEAKLIGGPLPTSFPTIVYLDGADLRGINLSGIDLSGIDLSGANLSGANLSGAILTFANLNLADLSRANLVDVDLEGASLNSVNLTDASLGAARLGGADLSRATLTYADLSYTTLSDTNLSFADLSYANLSYATLTQHQLDGVYTCKGATLPKRLTCHQTPLP